jgi:hypothetical protein
MCIPGRYRIQRFDPTLSMTFYRGDQHRGGYAVQPSVDMSCFMRVLSLAALCLAASLSFSSFADDSIVLTWTPQSLRTAQDALKRDLSANKSEYGHLTQQEKQAILSKQAPIYAMIDGRTSFDTLNDDDKRRLANAIEEVRALVAKAEDSRMICERVRVIGSNRPQNKCITAGERRRIREKAQQDGLRIDR